MDTRPNKLESSWETAKYLQENTFGQVKVWWLPGAEQLLWERSADGQTRWETLSPSLLQASTAEGKLLKKGIWP